MFTNAPRHWPVIDESQLQGTYPEQLAALATKLNGSNGVQVAGIQMPWLFPEGILLVVPIVVLDGEETRWVYLSVDPQSDISPFIHGANKATKLIKIPPVVYYSVRPIADAEPVVPTSGFSFAKTRLLREGMQGRWATWWATETEPQFATSNCRKLLMRNAELCDGIESYVMADAAAAWKLHNQGETARIRLPESLDLLVVGPNETQMLLSISQEKGFQWRFNMDKARTWYRDSFLNVFGGYLEYLRKVVETHKAPLDEDHAPLGWWRLTDRFAANPTKESGPITVLSFAEVK